MSVGRFSSAPFAIGDGFTVVFTFDDGAFDAQWSPDLPVGRRHLLAAYRASRDRFFADVSAEIGQTIAIIDL